MGLISEDNPQAAETNIRTMTLGAADIVVEELWEEAVASYFQWKYLSAVIIASTCAEAAHKFMCRFSGMNTQNVNWADLIDASVSNGLMTPHVGNVLHRIRNGYRNKRVHIDVDQITNGIVIPPTAGTRTVTNTRVEIETSPLEYKSIFTGLAAQQEALDCL